MSTIADDMTDLGRNVVQLARATGYIPTARRMKALALSDAIDHAVRNHDRRMNALIDALDTGDHMQAGWLLDSILDHDEPNGAA